MMHRRRDTLTILFMIAMQAIRLMAENDFDRSLSAGDRHDERSPVPIWHFRQAAP